MQTLLDYYRCPEDVACFAVPSDLGSKSSAPASISAPGNGRYPLPLDVDEFVECLRQERYVETHAPQSAFRRLGKAAYYALRPMIPFAVRSYLKRLAMRDWKLNAFPAWPVDCTVDETLENVLLAAMKAQGLSEVPFIWFWPNRYSGCVVMTHDVETSAGLKFCGSLMDLNDRFGIKSSFEIVPEGRYTVPADLLEQMRARGFEINVHDWNHDGKLFSQQSLFLERADKINQVAVRWGARGFRSGALYRNLKWYDAFTFEYDMSVPNVGHLDPQPGGCCTVMPYFIGQVLEIPLTVAQDYMLFHLLGEYSIDLWKRQLEITLKRNGLASFIVHPDYVIEARARAVYNQLLEHLSSLGSEKNVWIVPPGKVNRWWRNRSHMSLVRSNGQWEIAGPGREDACLAYAVVDGDRLRYEVARECMKV